MSCIGEEMARAEDAPESMTQWLHGIQRKANVVADKFSKLARDLKADADEEAEYERRMQDRQDEYWAAVAADREEQQ